MIPYGRQNISQKDIDIVLDVLKSDFLTQGPMVPLFEKELCEYTGAKYSAATSNATAALHIACLALGLGEGDWLWTSPNSFVASANCGLYCGAKIDFVDIDIDTYNMCPIMLEAKLVEAEKKGVLPKVVVPVHFAGQACKMKEIKELGDRFGFKIIEDASHAIGAEYLGAKVGNCDFSDITVFSFHPVKIITTAEGGAALTNSQELFEQLELLRSHGVTREQKFLSKDSEGGWYYEQVALGYNYRMTELQAALGVSQIERLDVFVDRRNVLANQYGELLENIGLTLPLQDADTKSSYHLYPVKLKDARERKKVFTALREAGIGVNVHYIPIHTQPVYKAMGFKPSDYPHSQDYYSRAISIPVYYDLSDDNQIEVVNKLKQFL